MLARQILSSVHHAGHVLNEVQPKEGLRMKTVEEIKTEIKALPYGEYMRLLHWFSEHDWISWDEEIERDSAAGKLDFLIVEALEEKAKGKLGQL